MRPWLVESSSEEEESLKSASSNITDHQQHQQQYQAQDQAPAPAAADTTAAAVITASTMNSPTTPFTANTGGWIEATDPNSGNIYYYNELTGVSQWDRPVELDQPQQQQAPPQSPAVAVQNQGPTEEHNVVEEEDEDAALVDEPLDEVNLSGGSPAAASGFGSPAGAAMAGGAATASFHPHQQQQQQQQQVNEIPVDEDEAYTEPSANTEPSAHTEESAAADESSAGAAGAHDLSFESLPSGWIEAVDPSSGRTYYYNQGTGASSWERPVIDDIAMTADGDDSFTHEQDGEDDVHGEEEHHLEDEPPLEEEPTNADVVSGDAFHSTEEPINKTDEDDEQEEAEGEDDDANITSDSHPQQLPPGWLEATDPNSGKVFYYNQDTGASSWDRPVMEIIQDEPNKEEEVKVDDAPVEEEPVVTDEVEEPEPFTPAVESMGAKQEESSPVREPEPVSSFTKELMEKSAGMINGGATLQESKVYVSSADKQPVQESTFVTNSPEQQADKSPNQEQQQQEPNTPQPSSPARISTMHVLDKKLIEPYHYINAVPGKDVRGKLIDCFQLWFNVPHLEILEEIKSIIADLHNASLLIDDIEDNSKLRRGVPVAHHIFGVAPVINTANYVYFLALERCAGLGNDRAMKVFVSEMLNLHRGQGYDIQWRDTTTCPTESQYIAMVQDKTGGLFRLAVGLLQSFATTCKEVDFVPLVNNLGLYFQIRDDLINLADEEYFKNKSFCEDLTEGKFSFPIIHCIRQEDEDSSAATQLLSILKQRTEDVDVKRYAQRLMFDAGSLRYTREKCDELKQEILQQIEELGGNEPLLKVMEMLDVSVQKIAETEDDGSFQSVKTPMGMKRNDGGLSSI